MKYLLVTVHLVRLDSSTRATRRMQLVEHEQDMDLPRGIINSEYLVPRYSDRAIVVHSK